MPVCSFVHSADWWLHLKHLGVCFGLYLISSSTTLWWPHTHIHRTVEGQEERKGKRFHIPELTTKHLSISPPVLSHNTLVNSSTGPFVKNGAYTYAMPSLSCRVIASSTRISPWPIQATAAPPLASRMRCPVEVVIQQPLPERAMGGGEVRWG